MVSTATDNPTEIARLERILARPWTEPKTDIIRRRNSVLQFDMIFTGPFGEPYETFNKVGERK